MEIKAVFERSYNQLLNKKQLIIPFVLIYLISGFVFLMIFHISGVQPVFKEAHLLQKQQIQEQLIKPSSLNLSLISKAGFNEPFKLTNYDRQKLLQFLTPANLVFLGISFLLFIFLSLYFVVASKAATALVVLNKKFTIKNIKTLTRKLFFRFIWLNILLGILILLTFLISALIPTLLGFLLILIFPKTLVLILTVPLLAILVMGGFIYIIIKIFFSETALFVDNLPALNNIKQSFFLTKGRNLEVFIIALFIFGVQMFFSFFFPPFQLDLLIPVSLASLLRGLFFAVIFLLLNGVLSAFTTLFVFNSYLEFKKNKKRGEVK